MKQLYDKTNRKQTQSPAANLNDKPIQNKAKTLQDNRSASILQKKVNNTGLPDSLKSGMENLSGHSMDDVKVHYNSDKPAQLQAHAYAQGTDIHIATGQEKHLPHEAWHVMQQKQGRVKPTMQMKGKININDNKSLEKEADLMGAKATSHSASVAVQRKENTTHNSGCRCTSCNSTTISKKANANSSVYQLVQCGECHKHNGHEKSCSHYKAPKKGPKKGKKAKDANIVGGSHNRGSYQQSGAGGDQHQKGFAAAVNVEKKTGFYAEARKGRKRKED